MYTQKEFSNLQFNPLCDSKIMNRYPQLKELITKNEQDKIWQDAWMEDADTDGIIRYAIMCFDPKSKLVLDERDINYRKQVAAELAGLKGASLLEDIYTFRDKRTLEVTCGYLMRFVKSREWSAIVALEYKFEENIKELMTPIKGDSNKERLEAATKKSVISTEIDADIKRLQSYYSDYFGYDVALQEAFKTERFTPEKMAKLRRSA